MKTLKNCEPSLPSPAPSDSSSLSPPETNSVEIHPETPTIDEFIKAINGGFQCLEIAGQILVALKEQDEGIFKKIMARERWVTAEILWSFHRIGEGKLYPQIMLLRKCEAQSDLLLSDYDTQRRLCNEPVAVVIELKKDGTPVIEKRWVQEIGKETTKLLFKNHAIRPVQEQVDILKARKKSEHVFQPPAIRATPESKPALNSVGAALQKKCVSRGVYSVQWKFGAPVLVKIKDKPYNTQTILLKEDGLKQLGAIIEFAEWQ